MTDTGAIDIAEAIERAKQIVEDIDNTMTPQIAQATPLAIINLLTGVRACAVLTRLDLDPTWSGD